MPGSASVFITIKLKVKLYCFVTLPYDTSMLRNYLLHKNAGLYQLISNFISKNKQKNYITFLHRLGSSFQLKLNPTLTAIISAYMYMIFNKIKNYKSHKQFLFNSFQGLLKTVCWA